MRLILLLLVLAAPALAQVNPDITKQAEQLATEWDEPEQAATGDTVNEADATAETAAAAIEPVDETGPEYQLVDLLGGKDQLPDVQIQLVDTLLAANPSLVDYQDTVRDWSRRYLRWEEMRHGMAKVYRDYFTGEEIEEMLTFYRSATGRKTVLLMPTLFREGSRIGMELAQAHKEELVEMIRLAREQQTPSPATP